MVSWGHHGTNCEVKSPVLYFLAVFPGTIIMCFASSLGHWIEDNIATLRGAEHIQTVAMSMHNYFIIDTDNSNEDQLRMMVCEWNIPRMQYSILNIIWKCNSVFLLM